MLKKFREIGTISSLLCLYADAEIFKDGEDPWNPDHMLIQYQFKGPEHNNFKPTPIHDYWKYAIGDEKTVMAICTDSNNHNFDASDSQFEGLTVTQG